MNDAANAVPNAVDEGRIHDAPLGDADLRERFEVETATLILRRIRHGAAILVGFLGLAVAFEVAADPSRARAVLTTYALEVLVCAAAIAAGRVRELQRHLRIVAIVLVTAIAALVFEYNGSIGRDLPLVVTIFVCILTGAAVVVPWGAPTQALLCILMLAALFATVPVPATGEPAVVGLALSCGILTSLVAAVYVDRHRFDAFARAELLGHAAVRHREDAEISAALVRIGAALGERIEEPRVLDRVVRVAIDTIGCDWATVFLPDETGESFRLAAVHGLPADVSEDLAASVFDARSFPDLWTAGGDGLSEVADSAVSGPGPVPQELLRRFGVSSILLAPLRRGPDVVGLLAVGFRSRVGSFSLRQRRLTAGIAAATAITVESQRLVARLKSASQLKSEFVSTMSHELRTPLNTVVGFIELLDDGDLGSLTPQQADATRRIRRSAVVLRDLVAATLDLGRLEAGRDVVRIERVEFDELLPRVCGDFLPLLPAGEVVLDWRNEVHSAVFSDGEKIATILRNLVGNAVKFTRRGAIGVRVWSAPGRLSIEVRDTGIGIDPQYRDTIFESFRQVDSSNARRFGGVGLGLHIVRRLVERLEGTVEVESKPGIGSTFRVSIPVQFGEPTSPSGAKPISSDPPPR